MPIIDRYLLRQYVKTFLICWFSLTGLYVVVDAFSNLDEFLRFVRVGGRTDTSPVAARMAVAAGVLATASLRDGGTPRRVPPLDPGLAAYFDNGQVRS